MSRFRSSAGIALLVLALSALPGMLSAQERVPLPGATYFGTLTDSTGECGRGDLTIGPEISFTASEYGSRITGIGLTGLSYSGLDFVPSSFTLGVNIPVDGSGAFSRDFSQYSIDTHIEGWFEGMSLSGRLRASIGGVTECEGTFAAEATPSLRGETQFFGTIESQGDCGGGRISITRSADLLSISKMSIDGFQAGNDTVSGSAMFTPGTTPISAETGTFNWVYFDTAGGAYEIAASGSFPYSWQLNGAVVVSPSSCGMVPFTAAPVPTTGGNPRLPNVGGGPASASRSAGLWWALLAAGIGGALVVSGGAALRRR